jgi:hypothetical protein
MKIEDVTAETTDKREARVGLYTLQEAAFEILKIVTEYDSNAWETGTWPDLLDDIATGRPLGTCEK